MGKAKTGKVEWKDEIRLDSKFARTTRKAWKRVGKSAGCREGKRGKREERRGEKRGALEQSRSLFAMDSLYIRLVLIPFLFTFLATTVAYSFRWPAKPIGSSRGTRFGNRLSIEKWENMVK